MISLFFPSTSSPTRFINSSSFLTSILTVWSSRCTFCFVKILFNCPSVISFSSTTISPSFLSCSTFCFSRTASSSTFVRTFSSTRISPSFFVSTLLRRSNSFITDDASPSSTPLSFILSIMDLIRSKASSRISAISLLILISPFRTIPSRSSPL